MAEVRRGSVWENVLMKTGLNLGDHESTDGGVPCPAGLRIKSPTLRQQLTHNFFSAPGRTLRSATFKPDFRYAPAFGTRMYFMARDGYRPNWEFKHHLMETGFEVQFQSLTQPSGTSIMAYIH